MMDKTRRGGGRAGWPSRRLGPSVRRLAGVGLVSLVLGLPALEIGAAAQEAGAPPTVPAQAPGLEPPDLSPPGAVEDTEPAAADPAPAVADPGPAPEAAEPAPEAAEPAAAGAGAPADPAAAARLPHDLSAWGMFRDSGAVVKAVMIGLALASVVTWTVAFAKIVELAAAKRRLRRDLRQVLGAPRIEASRRGRGRLSAAERMLAAAEAEMGAVEAPDAEGRRSLLDRVSSHLGRIEAQEGRRLTIGTGALATIGATAPFVGLFGTVWGIMNSFIGIADSQTTNLAVVAPGIAEALLATALGLVAAIPAVVLYNHFARSVADCRALLADLAAAVERLASRDLDSARLSRPGRRHAAE